MAGDWIKMRINLVTHPKVMAIAEFLSDEPEYQDWSTLSSFIAGYGGSDADNRNERYSALRVTRYVTVCGLLRFWGYANEHARGEFIEFASLSDVDEVVQIPCFGKALESVGWIKQADGDIGLELPNFAEFNAVAAERSSSAERQKRYRERKKSQSGDDNGDVTRHVTVTPREEKRREEKKERVPRFDAQAHLESLGVDSAVAGDWLATRKRKKLESTRTAMDQTQAEVSKSGLSMNDALRECCLRGWGGFKAEWMAGGSTNGRMNGHTDNPFA
jgi:hypothetical protein